MGQSVYSYGTFGEHKPFSSPEEAQKRLQKVKEANADARFWLSSHGYQQKTTSKIEVVKVKGGYMVQETITDLYHR